MNNTFKKSKSDIHITKDELFSLGFEQSRHFREGVLVLNLSENQAIVYRPDNDETKFFVEQYSRGHVDSIGCPNIQDIQQLQNLIACHS